jgi:hypothetical protein
MEPNKPVQVYFDASLLAQLTEVMILRQSTAPNPERAAAIKELKHIRDLVIHGLDPVDLDVARDAVSSLFGHLLQLERSSLGTPGARRLRRRTSARTICEILNRAEDDPGEAFPIDTAVCQVFIHACLEDAQQHTNHVLRDHELDPQDAWTTGDIGATPSGFGGHV